MIRRVFTRVLPSLALSVIPVFATCKLPDTVVGADSANDGGAMADAGCTIVPTCAPSTLPSGCTWGQVTCNSATKTFSCPEPVCPDSGAAGSACTAAGGVCTATGTVACANQAPDADQDCNPTRNPGGSFCCIEGATDAGTCVEIDASSFDQSCKATSDCVPVFAGELCAGACRCPNATINASSTSAYATAISEVPSGQTCGCPAYFPPECLSGKCVLTGPGQGVDSGTPFTCGTEGLTCNPSSQYCSVTEGGPISPDGSTAYTAVSTMLRFANSLVSRGE